jgi:hypothetical protein
MPLDPTPARVAATTGRARESARAEQAGGSLRTRNPTPTHLAVERRRISSLYISAPPRRGGRTPAQQQRRPASARRTLCSTFLGRQRARRIGADWRWITGRRGVRRAAATGGYYASVLSRYKKGFSRFLCYASHYTDGRDRKRVDLSPPPNHTNHATNHVNHPNPRCELRVFVCSA